MLKFSQLISLIIVLSCKGQEPFNVYIQEVKNDYCLIGTELNKNTEDSKSIVLDTNYIGFFTSKPHNLDGRNFNFYYYSEDSIVNLNKYDENIDEEDFCYLPMMFVSKEEHGFLFFIIGVKTYVEKEALNFDVPNKCLSAKLDLAVAKLK